MERVNRMLKVDLSIANNTPTSNNESSPSLLSPASSSSSNSAISPPPSNPIGLVANSNQISDPVHDLPADLLAQGWRKFWSKREGRPYYFNKVTNESLWDPPHLVGVQQITDPLGISSFNDHQPTSPAPSPPVANANTPGGWPMGRISGGEKRSLSTDESINGPQVKRPYIVHGPWSLETPSNAVIWEKLPCLMHHIHPEVELLRAQLMCKLRQQYIEMCKSRENLEAPKQSLNRWLLERKLHDKGPDALFPSSCSNEISRPMYHEIMNDIPIRLARTIFPGEARKQLSRYAEAAKKMIESRTASPESRKIVKWNVEDTFNWIRKTTTASFDDYQDRLHHLRQQCQPHLTEAAKSSVEGICHKVYITSVESAKKSQDRLNELVKEQGIRELITPPRLSTPIKKVYCYPIHLIQPVLKLPPVQFFHDKDSVILRYKSDGQKIRTLHLQKLEQLYRYNCTDDRKFDLFTTRVWCLLRRYNSFMGNVPVNASGENTCFSSLPLPVYDCLRKQFEVTFEAFASPLDCFFKQYCSPFPDTDSYFGSRGSFFTFHPISGSFSVHPPIQEDLMDATIEHIERCLHNTQDPLSFIIFLPDWKNPIPKAVNRIDSSRFKRKHISLEPLEHEFKLAYLHMLDTSKLESTCVRSSRQTLIAFLQNDAGFIRWGPTPDRIEALIESFRPGKEIARDRENSLLSPPLTPQNSANCNVIVNSSANNGSSSSSTHIVSNNSVNTVSISSNPSVNNVNNSNNNNIINTNNNNVNCNEAGSVATSSPSSSSIINTTSSTSPSTSSSSSCPSTSSTTSSIITSSNS